MGMISCPAFLNAKTYLEYSTSSNISAIVTAILDIWSPLQICLFLKNPSFLFLSIVDCSKISTVIHREITSEIL